ncbi:MAG: hypothetical protein ACJAS4_001143 [Bacteriovoracaceae bacterium]|jgi:hypothetical protein
MKDHNSYQKDYSSFKSSNELAPTQDSRQAILKHIKEDLSVEHKSVFFKTLLIQAFIGTLTLLFCPQFNMSLTNNFELFHYFHHTFGDQICMTICGGIFIGTGSFFASTILKASELRLITNHKFFYLFFISGFLITGLLLFGAEIFLAGLVFWLAGALISGSFIFECAHYIKGKRQA